MTPEDRVRMDRAINIVNDCAIEVADLGYHVPSTVTIFMGMVGDWARRGGCPRECFMKLAEAAFDGEDFDFELEIGGKTS